MAAWDPAQYERYKTYRDRPPLDLLVRLPTDLEPELICDLGCGTGEHAALLARRHPEARVIGLDSSEDMLNRARARADARVEWVLGDIAQFSPDAPVDLLFTNAALHWLPDHAALIPRLAAMLAPGGVFACQMPVSHDAVWHGRLRETADRPEWRARFSGIEIVQPLLKPEGYHDLLSATCETDIWTTTYLHVLSGEDPVVDWMLGTGLRPYLDRLPEPEAREAFLADYRLALGQDFPRRSDGTTLFPFPRLFILARRR